MRLSTHVSRHNTITQSIKKNPDRCDLIISLNCCRQRKAIYERKNCQNKVAKFMPDEGLMYLV